MRSRTFAARLLTLALAAWVLGAGSATAQDEKPFVPEDLTQGISRLLDASLEARMAPRSDAADAAGAIGSKTPSRASLCPCSSPAMSSG